jgi:hypothetical protein
MGFGILVWLFSNDLPICIDGRKVKIEIHRLKVIMSKEYTDKQLNVIKIKRGYNMVLAGPGCGKTDILA